MCCECADCALAQAATLKIWCDGMGWDVRALINSGASRYFRCVCRCGMRPGVLGQIRVLRELGWHLSHSHRIANAPIPSRCASYLALGQIPLFWPPFRCFGSCFCHQCWRKESSTRHMLCPAKRCSCGRSLSKRPERQILRCRPLGRLGSAICICVCTPGSWERRSGGLCGDETPVCAGVELVRQSGSWGFHEVGVGSWELRAGVEAETEMHLSVEG